MKLSELVDYYQQIRSYNIDEMASSLNRGMETLMNAVGDNKVPEAHDKIRFGDGNYLNQIHQDIDDLRLTAASIKNNHKFYLEQLENAIVDIEQEYLKHSVDLFNNGMKYDEADLILNRKLSIPKDSEEKMRNRLSIYSDWRYPGLCLGPMRTPMIDEMLSSDPLYLCDIDEALINPLVESYNDVYKNRVRPYVIPRYENGKRILRELPSGQFSIIFAGNFFEYIPLDDIRKILTEMKDLLRPGGTIMFTFNDCDNTRNIKLVERNFRTYTPKRLLKKVVTDIGFEVIFSYDANSGFSWMEIKKSGTLETIRGGQSLAQVIGGGDVEINTQRKYTREEQDIIINEAIALGIDKEEVIRKGAISVGKLELLIKRRKHAMQEERRLINDIGEQNSKDD